MHIDQIILEGFKSYATRTVIGKWDPSFNAITGLNGSGKSNILDAICFVLGISNLSSVRATSLQDLVYKKGQAGINKASVTIVFDNSDPEKSPMGYKDSPEISITRQYIVGGKNKYIINGHNKAQQDVTMLFQSVSLNVNNPHFLIMQGKITQVLNMKPMETLSMIEEAAGTRMYEDRKDKALKTIVKKDTKLMEISTLLESEVLPKLEKLREAKRVLLEFQNIERELEKTRMVVIAFEYHKLDKLQSKADQEFKRLSEKLDNLKSVKSSLEEEIQELERDFQELSQQRQTSELAQLDEVCKEKNKEHARLRTLVNLKEASLKEEEQQTQNLQQSILETEAQIKEAALKIERVTKECQSSISEHTLLADQVKQLEQLIQTLTTGVSGSGNDSYMDQLSTQKKQLAQIQSEEEQSKIKESSIQREIKDIEPKAAKAQQENHSLLKDLESRKQSLQELESQTLKLDHDLEKEQDLLRKVQAQKESQSHLREDMDRLQRQSYSFSYSDPVPKFDRSQVRGLVAELIDIQDENRHCMVALEVCAGGKLFNVVIDNEIVGSQLLSKGNLKRRVTFIPLNKISSQKIQPERIQTAKKLAPGQVDLALDLIQADPSLSEAMRYVFGSTIVAQDVESARIVTFDKNVRMRSVTLDGDVYDPSGQLSGGSRANNVGTLNLMQKLKTVKQEYQQSQQTLKSLEQELSKTEQMNSKYRQAKEQLDMKTHELQLLESRLQNNPHIKLVHRLEELRKDLLDIKEQQKQLGEQKSKLVETIQFTEKEMHELSTNRDSKLQSLRDQLKSNKAKLQSLDPMVNQMEQKLAIAREEHLQLTQERESLSKSLAQQQEQYETCQDEFKCLEKEFLVAQAEFEQAKQEFERERKSNLSVDKELNMIEQKKKTRTRELSETQIGLQQADLEFGQFKKDAAHAQQSIKKLESQHKWILDQKALFGNSPEYDFAKMDLKQSQQRIEHLTSRYEALKRTVDRNVLDKYDRLEKKQQQLSSNLNTVQRDKANIFKTIETLDERKMDKLQKTWKQVSQDFGSIFGELLPGNTCKLVPPAPDFSQGLEIKVCLGKVWKQSLTELSGGQRSLIALSLILSLLQFNPAPMYILDEVDAALDLSHTQNIGKLLKTRFKGSQFILVSLKDGMYQNANCLFRTKFVDGVSKVDRIQQKS
ncbi:condensin subunit [Gorgonomyces haynaldii]|nr:condensin subunit [Gorgonomyces haynaldii]